MNRLRNQKFAEETSKSEFIERGKNKITYMSAEDSRINLKHRRLSPGDCAGRQEQCEGLSQKERLLSCQIR